MMNFPTLVFLYLLACLPVSAQTITAGDTAKTLPSLQDTIFNKVEIEAKFGKGGSAWNDFLQDHMRSYPKEAAKEEVQGVVVVQFVVERDGSISNVKCLFGPELLRDDAVKLIMKSPRWTPATNKGEKVRSYKKQPIVYKLQSY